LFDLPVLQRQGVRASLANTRTTHSELGRAKGIARRVDPGAAAVPGAFHPGFQLASCGIDASSIVRCERPSGLCKHGSPQRCTEQSWRERQVGRTKAAGVSESSNAHSVLLSDRGEALSRARLIARHRC
jgi:hypothetical protein